MIADIVAQDSEDRIFLVVEVKPWPGGPAAAADFAERLHREVPTLSYGMFVDLDHIIVYDPGLPPGESEMLRLRTRPVLKTYSEEFADAGIGKNSPQVLEDYTRVLTEAWLADVGRHRKLAEPPSAAELRRIGLAALLREGTTRMEVLLAEALR